MRVQADNEAVGGIVGEILGEKYFAVTAASEQDKTTETEAMPTR